MHCECYFSSLERNSTIHNHVTLLSIIYNAIDIKYWWKNHWKQSIVWDGFFEVLFQNHKVTNLFLNLDFHSQNYLIFKHKIFSMFKFIMKKVLKPWSFVHCSIWVQHPCDFSWISYSDGSIFHFASRLIAFLERVFREFGCFPQLSFSGPVLQSKSWKMTARFFRIPFFTWDGSRVRKGFI